ncbi:MAG: V-type ATP synthase subunit D [Fulvivirga sp.]|nr:V-type ATP synthase subunit D [Fulvivirga sp.]
MALNFQYNKTTIQELKKQLAIRQKALPILKNKETALRKEIKDRQKRLEKVQMEWKTLISHIQGQEGLWYEFPEILFLDKTQLTFEKVIGVKIPSLMDIKVNMTDISWWHFSAWIPSGVDLIKKGVRLTFTLDILEKQIEILDEARKKTTQKVNLYEKVQIPEMEDAILKIKRFLEDKENIAKAAQKIIKNRKERSEAI